MARLECIVCGYVHDEEQEGTPFDRLPGDWVCPICGSGRELFSPAGEESPGPAEAPPEGAYLEQWRRPGDEVEPVMAAIHQMAETGESIISAMRSRKPQVSWDEVLIRGAQLARLPLNEEDPVCTRTVIGPGAAKPLVIDTPIYISHMSFGALSREAKVAMARGSAAAGSAMCSGEGGILQEEREAAHRYIFEYVPNRYSVTEENLRAADAIEIKFGQSAKPGMGGHLPGGKVTDEIAAIRGFPAGADIISPAHFPDIRDGDELKQKVDWLREVSGGRPVGIKVAAGQVEKDLEVALAAGVDFITVDGRAGGTGAGPQMIKDAASMPTIYALHRARAFLDRSGADGVSLLITGGLRVSSDFAKALAMGADAVAIATAAMMAVGCQQYRVCNTGKCPVGVATQDPELRARLDVDQSARRVERFLEVCTEELATFARLTGHNDVHGLEVSDLCTTSSEISGHTNIEHA